MMHYKLIDVINVKIHLFYIHHHLIVLLKLPTMLIVNVQLLQLNVINALIISY